MSVLGLASSIFNKRKASEGKSTSTIQVTGTAVEASEAGYVDILIDGSDVVMPDSAGIVDADGNPVEDKTADEIAAGLADGTYTDTSKNTISVPTTPAVEAGDKVLINANGGVVKDLQVIANIGSGDKIKEQASEAKKAADAAASAANTASEKAAALEGELDTANQKLEQVASDVNGVKTTVTNAVTKADEAAETANKAATAADEAASAANEAAETANNASSSATEALTVATEAKQTATEVKTTAESAYKNANEALTQASSATQTATEVKTEVEQNYLKNSDAQETYATKSSVEQTVEGVETKISLIRGDVETYSTLIRQSENGVEVARKVDGAYTSTKTIVGSDGLEVLEVDKEGNDGDSVAQFSSTARIGKSSANHVEIDRAQVGMYIQGVTDPVATFDASGLSAYRADIAQYVDIGDYRIRDCDGMLQWFYKGASATALATEGIEVAE